MSRRATVFKGRWAGVQALAETANLKVAGDKETAASEAEWRQLTQLIEHDRKQKVLCFPAFLNQNFPRPCMSFCGLRCSANSAW
jgi:hypothetical protein